LDEEQSRKCNPSRWQQLHLRFLEAVFLELCFVEFRIFELCSVELGVFKHRLVYYSIVVGNSIKQLFCFPLPSGKRTDHH
jgi:hypothetical protein